MIRPRGADGTFLSPFDPLRYYPDATIASIDAPYYEGNAWQWTTFVPHDAHGLVRRVGGDAAFTTWLDEYFDRGVHDPANEHDLLAPYLYIYAGRPDRTQNRVRDLLDDRYSDQPAGLPGNDDAGALSAWYAWAAMGLYPNAGQPIYFITAPLFRSVRVLLGAGRAFEVRAPAASPANRFIRSARLDGRPLDRAFIRHDELARGGVLELELGPRPTAWGSRERPPSVSRRP
jgi:predicted alpha-1,2-mannosidase